MTGRSAPRSRSRRSITSSVEISPLPIAHNAALAFASAAWAPANLAVRTVGWANRRIRHRACGGNGNVDGSALEQFTVFTSAKAYVTNQASRLSTHAIAAT